MRRFTQLLGIYPAGNLVRLDTGEVAVVLLTYAADPFRPRVRVLLDASGAALHRPYDLDLWAAREGQPRAVQAPLDAATFGIDPLAYLS